MLFMVKFNDLSDTQKTDKKARFNVLAEEIDAAVAGDSTIADKVEELETTVGKASGEGAGGLAKDVDDLKTAVGDESTEGSILARIKALEDAP